MTAEEKETMQDTLDQEPEATEAEDLTGDTEGCGETQAGSEDGTEEEAAKDSESDDAESDPDGEAAEDEDSEEEGKSGERKVFRKKSKTDKKQEALKERIAELEDRVMRQMAEFENFRKRTDREKQAMFETGAKSVIEKILPVVDNFERGLAMVPEEEKESPFVDGMNKIYKQLMQELDNMDVKPIAAVGEEFNPDLHNAVMQVESEEFESGVVAQELQKGYTYRDSVVRHSMVAVVQ